jgi:hypothetical protein
MKTYVHLWYIAELFLEWETFQTEVVEKMKKKTHFMFINFSHKSCRLCDIVE